LTNFLSITLAPIAASTDPVRIAAPRVSQTRDDRHQRQQQREDVEPRTITINPVAAE
jgi:hypothetical protein